MRPILALLLGAVFASCGGSPPWPEDLEKVDHPQLGAVEEVAREQLEEARSRVDELLGRGRGEPSELAGAFGNLGRLYHAYHLYEPAAACYVNAETLDPRSFLWPYYLGLVEQTRGRFEAARTHFERALEIGPDNGPARLRLGDVLLALGDGVPARACFEPLAEDERYAAVALAGLGRLEASAGEAERAVAYFEKALELRPEMGGVHHALGTALTRLGRLEEARDHLGHPGSDEAGFPDPLAERLDELAVTSGSYLRRGSRALLAGRLDEAAEAYRQAAEADPESVAARRNLALALVRRGDLAEALRQLEAAREIASADAAVCFDLGNVYRARGESAAAVDAYLRALEIDPGFVTARFNLANVLAGENRWDEAGEHLAEVLKAEPGHSRARYLAAMAHHRRGHSEEAVEELSELVGAEPDNIVARRGLAGVLAALGREQRALALYHEILARDLPAAEKAEVLGEAARLAWRFGRHAEAIDDFRRAVDLEPDSSEAYTQLANALQLADERQEALELFARARELDPKNGTAWLSEASLLILAEDYGRAVARLDEALRQVPGHPGLVHTLARLLATCPDSELRDGARALALARSAYEAEHSLEHAATVAMALAEVGRFEEAAAWQRSLVRQAPAGQPAVVERLRAHLGLYERKRPVRITDD